MFRNFLLIIFAALFISTALAQQPTQIIRGRVVDAMSNSPVAFASIIILDSDPIIGSTTDFDGTFSLPAIPVGRYNIKVTCIGYEPAELREILVISARETFLDISLRASVTNLDEVVVRASVNKQDPLNSMAMVSARMLSVEESKRYAGGFDDPARLASAFAGVASNIRSNGIAVRGNAPRSLQWKMEGVEIPNPNHFADLSSFGGGGLTALSTQLLANSDFFTSAFPAEYSNALSGVFDIFMRNGNMHRHNHSFQIGVVGIDAASEGPLSGSGNSSYIFNYRYSTLALVQPLLPQDAEDISYQDLSFKLHFQTRKAGVISFWGIGLMDKSGQTANTDSLEWQYMQDREEGSPKQYMGASGLNHVYFFNENTSLRTTLAATAGGLDWEMERLNEQLELKPQSHIRYTNWHFVLTSALNNKFSSSHTNKSGFTITGLLYDMFLNDAGDSGGSPITITDESGFSTLISAYSSSSLRISQSITLNLGLTGQFFALNNQFSLEPRAGVNWAITHKHALAFGYGLHSRLERLNYYFSRTPETGDTLVNRDIEIAKAHHFVLSYSVNLSSNMILKIEPYFQQLYDVPVVPGSSFSFINLQDQWFFNQKLESFGKGRNYGIDLTLEQYFNRGYYFLITTSLFNSEYLGGDKVWRNTAFNRNYLLNLLGGKEWQTGKTKQNAFGLNIRLAFQGGDPYTPYDEAASLAAQDVIYIDSLAFSMQNNPMFMVHFTASYIINRNKVSHEIALKLLNMTAQDDFFGFRYNYQTNSVEKHFEAIVIPNLSYRIQF